jgi:glucoamylase
MKRSLFWINVLVLTAGASAQAGTDAYRAQFDRSVQGVFANMLDNGATVASPSKTDPDYYYDWVRDTSLTMKMVVQLSQDSSTPAATRKALLARIDTWINFELGRQRTPTLTDLGEPKFYVTGKANLEPWGRPQNDGPALRALTAIEIANTWIQKGRFDDVREKLYRAELPANTLIKRDLEYVSHHWMETSFDLWEEERAMHFYTLTVQKVALLKGAKLAQTLGDADAASFYSQQSKAIDNYLSAFVDSKRGIIRYAINKDSPLPHKKSDLDIAVLLAAIQTFDGQFYVPVQAMINTVNQISQTFQSLYSINQVRTTKEGLPLGVALGRYPDDKYSGFDFSSGNPWFLATLALAEFSCDLNKTQSFNSKQKSQLNDTAVKQFNRVLYHRLADGSLSEQFNRDSGYEQGARDLTWSYASYVTAYRACFK